MPACAAPGGDAGEEVTEEKKTGAFHFGGKSPARLYAAGGVGR